MISSEDEHTRKTSEDDDSDEDGHCILFVFLGHEVRDTVHADGSTWEMYLPGTIVVTQGNDGRQQRTFCEYMYPRGGLLLCRMKKGSEDHIH